MICALGEAHEQAVQDRPLQYYPKLHVHVDASVAVVPVQRLAVVAYCEHVMHDENVAPSPKCPALQTHVGTFAVLPAAQLTAICAFGACCCTCARGAGLPMAVAVVSEVTCAC